MKRIIFSFLVCISQSFFLYGQDWLIDGSGYVSTIVKTPDGMGIMMTNGLISREFRISPGLSTINISNLMTGDSMLRTACSEGTLTIDGKDYPLGGLSGVEERGYMLPEWIDGMLPLENSFRVVDWTVTDLKPRMEWNRKRWALVKEWNPTGKELTITLEGPGDLKGVKVDLHYEIYDGAPIIGKWLIVRNETGRAIMLDKFTLEELAFVEYESDVDHVPASSAGSIHVESDWAQVSCGTTFWGTDPKYTSQVNYGLQTQCFLTVKLPNDGPAQEIPSGERFESFRNWLMPFDSQERERKGLFLRHFKRILAPWTTENPIFLHLTSTKLEDVKTAIEQCVETGYEMIILSFGSGLDMEDESEENISKFKEYVDLAHSKGIEIGGYSLLASRWISDDVDVINPRTGKRGGMTF